jgi:xanthine dehydrogenase molybdopterin-binding subunit B
VLEVWEGTTYIIGQHAFPMEKQAALAVPEEKKGMTVSW